MRKPFGALVVIALLFATTTFAAPRTFVATLSGPAENPPIASPGTGFATVTLDSVAHVMTVDVVFSGLVEPTTAAHIHCCVAPPGTAPVATTTPTFPGFPSGVTAGSYSQTFDMTQASSYNPAFLNNSQNLGSTATAEATLEAGLLAGAAYFNIHTTFAPGGEIRGFLQLVHADLAVTKTDGTDPILAGSSEPYTVTLTNNGPNDASDVVLTDVLPAGMTPVSFAQQSGPAFTLAFNGSDTYTASITTLAAGATATFLLQATVGAQQPHNSVLTNTASVTSSTTDETPANNSATATTTVVNQADLSVTKIDGTDPVHPGGSEVYTLTLTNSGPLAATNVVLSDTVPAGMTPVAFNQQSGPAFTLAFNGSDTYTASIASLAAGQTATFTLTATVNAAVADGTTITNSVSVTSETVDPDPADNTASATTTVTVSADLQITKIATTSPPVLPSGNVNYLITVTNNGPNEAQGVSVTDTLPPGATFVSATPSQGSCSGTGPVVCAIGTLANGASATITLGILAPALPGSFTNTATVSGGGADANSSNNTGSSTLAVTAPAGIPLLSPPVLLLLAAMLGGIALLVMRN